MINAALRSALDIIAARSPLLIASDYDGVLSPIVDDPAEAVPDHAGLEALVDLGQMPGTHAVAISGRSLAMLRQLMGDPPGVALVGTHGAEESGTEIPEELRDQVDHLQAALLALAKQHPGALVEKKPIGAAFHYRHAARGSEAAGAARAIATACGARTISGKMVVECLYGDVDKGEAIGRFVERLAIASTMYLGDDTTDEHAFAVLGDDDIGIKVGPGETCARYRIDHQAEVSVVLKYLADRRRAL